MKKFVYYFGKDLAEGRADMKNLLGGKGANLSEMCSLGIPVPAGFTITTEVCTEYYENNQNWPEGLEEQVNDAIAKVENIMAAKFADPTNPLLLSVRSGARVSMPGMMDTILNLGLNETTIKGLEVKNARFAWDSFRRFLQMYGGVVLELDHHDFEHILDGVKKEKGVKLDTDLDTDDLKEVVKRYKAMIVEKTGAEFPSDPREQLKGAINAVFRSWMNPRANLYRSMHDIPESWGTAVNVQAMVFGNMGETSGTGVAFTRNPSTGENLFYGEYLMNAQGEDVVAGIRTPHPIAQLEETNAVAYKELCDIYHNLEKHYRDMQDMEFTIQEGTLYMLQTRSGKRTGPAAVRMAVEMAEEGLITDKEAIMRVAPEQLDQLLHPMVDPKAKLEKLAQGLPASPGAAVGTIVFSAEDAAAAVAENPKAKVILVRTETSPEDLAGMVAAQGILTSRGGMTSHAAVVARGMGKCCVAGCADAVVNEKAKTVTIGGKTLKEGEWITLNGTTGDVINGETKLIEPELSGYFGKLMLLADKYRVLKVRTNADTPHDAQVARSFGAEGIGLTRTEHMFFAEDRILAFRQMIVADEEADRRAALEKILPYQKADFKGIFEVMDGLPVTIRLLDPPLHEFLPHEPAAQATVAKELGISIDALKAKVEGLHEFNPMLGFRGCRLGIVYPEIFEMQVRAIFEAACEVVKERGIKIVPEVMIPLVGTTKEFTIIREYSEKVAKEVMAGYGVELEYMIGTMIEIPRAALLADKIAETAEFFSFGTNDLTQMTFGYSRDDAGRFLPTYVKKGILEKDPTQAIDQEGVGQLIEMGVKKGRSTRPKIKIGICGEHGGEPSSIEFCHKTGLDYVSCSPYRVPIARLAAAQSELKSPRAGGEGVKEYSTK